MKTIDWKNYYLQMEKLHSEQNSSNESEQEVVAIPIKPKLTAKERTARALLVVRQMIRREEAKLEQQRRARDIRQVDGSLYKVKSNSIEDYILQFLSSANTSTHINDIIVGIEALGWTTSSIYHKHKLVCNALRSNDYMFCKTGPGMFRLRNAFRKTEPKNSVDVVIERERLVEGRITSLKEIVAGIVMRYGENGISPTRTHYVLTHYGYACSYSAVRAAMQCNLFIREGNSYRIASSNKNSTSNSSVPSDTSEQNNDGR